MSNSETGKKCFERNRLELFLEAYREITDIAIDCTESGERPDFICTMPDSIEVGIELTRSPHDFEGRTHDAIWAEGTMDHFDLLEAVHQIVITKSAKIKEPDWRTKETILVVFLEDYSFDSLDWIDSAGIESEFSEYGFFEIWLADCSTIEPFNAVRLIGLHPQSRWGIFPQPSLMGKPFG